MPGLPRTVRRSKSRLAWWYVTNPASMGRRNQHGPVKDNRAKYNIHNLYRDFSPTQPTVLRSSPVHRESETSLFSQPRTVREGRFLWCLFPSVLKETI